MAATNDRVLTKMVEAFNELADDVNSPSTPPRLSLSKFCSACRLLSPLIRCMGIAFRFADIEFSAKAICPRRSGWDPLRDRLGAVMPGPEMGNRRRTEGDVGPFGTWRLAGIQRTLLIEPEACTSGVGSEPCFRGHYNS
ncbi:hypothetical protein RHSIM_Rhsim09G0132700 [Rhododendron simsii]|uniref:Uncharacterized protein n=1 Tax=Rhododendron simsii TaxID=118357 RepID=A0A834LCM4_RHOSS|nr:hypothetical protein RHSIM_Rhsim09G0132700 [Rhododendron simsii]